MPMKSERRISKRFDFDSPVRYQEKGSQKITNTTAKDLSNSGIGFISDEFIPKSSQLVFEIHPPGYQEYMKVLGEVMWVSNQPFSERFYVGARFINPPEPV